MVVGNRIAYATSQGSSITMKIGTIVELVPPIIVGVGGPYQQPPKLRVLVEATSGYGKPAKPVLLTSFNRVVKL